MQRNKEYILYWDFDTPLFSVCASCEDRTIIAKHKELDVEKECKNITEFWGSKQKEIGGWLSKQNKNWKRDDFEITHKIKRNNLPVFKALEHLDNKINYMKKQPFCKKLNLVVQGIGNFRKDIYPEYKQNRPEKPIVFEELRSIFIDKYKPIVIDGIESDDVISILQNWSYNGFGKDTEYGFVFVDHDLEQNPCWRVNPNKIEKGINWINEEHANRVFFQSILSGDTGDNIPGIESVPKYIWDKYKLRGRRYSIGNGNAKKILSDCKTRQDMIERVQDLYQHYYCDIWKEKLDINYRLLKLLEKKDELELHFPFNR